MLYRPAIVTDKLGGVILRVRYSVQRVHITCYIYINFNSIDHKMLLFLILYSQIMMEIWYSVKFPNLSA